MLPALAVAPRPIPAWMHGRCCRCLARGHRAAECRDPFRCSRCLENGHRARGCRNPGRLLSSLSCLAVQPLVSTVHRPASASCESPMKSTLPSKVLPHGSWASVVSATVGSTTQPDVMLQAALAEQTALLQGWMARAKSFLERAEAALGKLTLVSTVLPTALTSCPPGVVGVASTKEGSQELYGCFSPRVGDISSAPLTLSPVLRTSEGEPIAVPEAPVLQIMPDLQELCLCLVSPLSVERVEVDSSVTSCEGYVSPLSCEQLEVPESVSVVPVGDVVMPVVSVADNVDAVCMLAPDSWEPSQPLAFVDRGGSDVVVTHSQVAVGKVSVRDKVDEILFELEVHSLLKRLEAACPGSGKAIVEEALIKSKSKKSGGAGKASAAA
ncbi:unnamed protein product [Triticum turgidum subsp. durum]|uniref:CCHC-type domain-containing protein n=1 Tax=Triticum turgidum subsp. durum TaxID=4567 RepID=A0A9R0QFX6_TRITD|nr:unnamed protein product [Triticum turgidum subsp. durum]